MAQSKGKWSIVMVRRLAVEIASITVVIATGLLLNVAIPKAMFRAIPRTEIHHYMVPTNLSQTISNIALWSTSAVLIALSFCVILLIKRSFKLAFVYASMNCFGLAAKTLLTYFAKSIIIKLRPDAFSKCSYMLPILLKDHMSIDELFLDTLTICKDTSKSFNESFFSGHAATMVYSTLSFVLLLEYLTKNFARTLLISILVLYGMLISFSRRAAGRHHFEDVVFGIICGVIFAVYVYYEFRAYRKNNRRKERSCY
eukprot:GAHX01002090.1.p1 GENE.GAHX01002090.1~~GAHX01002090.1.p1  ORF type:complete len:256 (+),score=19.79 GAHX01002090.1:50-817(+)